MPSEVSGRLHPATILMALVEQLRWLALPTIGLVAFGGAASGFLAPLFAVAALQFVFQGLVRYLTLTYRLDEADLVIRDGIVSRNERHIPVERIQDLQIEQNVFQRALGVAVVRVQTAGGGNEPEAKLAVLGLDEVERLRAALAIRAPRAPLAAAEELPREVIRRLDVRQIVLAGLTSKILAPLLAFLGSIIAFADDLVPGDIYSLVATRVYEEGRRVVAGETELAFLAGVAALAAAFLLGLVASAVWHVALFYDFTLSRVGEKIERTYGLLTRRTSSLPRRRIQVLEIEQSLLRRLAGLASIRADVAGSAGEEGEKGGRDVVLPVVGAREAEGVLPHLFPDFDEEPPEWQSVSRRAIRRGTSKGLLACLLLTVPELLRVGAPWGLWPLALAPLAYLASVLSYRNLGYALGERFLRTRRGWIGHSMHVVPIRNVQAVVVRQTPFDRRLGLATVAVDTAGQSFTGGGPSIPSLPLREAHALARALAHRSQANSRG